MNKRNARKAAKRLTGLTTNVPRQIQYTQWFRVFDDAVRELNKALKDKETKGKKVEPETPVDEHRAPTPEEVEAMNLEPKEDDPQ